MNNFFENIFDVFREPSSEDIENITDCIFLCIEDTSQLLRQYQDLVNQNGQATVNRNLGRWIRERYGLTNLGRNYQPRSRLIQSYERHGRA